jgi:hypothetical protein
MNQKITDAQIEGFKKMLNSYFMLNIDSQNFIEDLIQKTKNTIFLVIKKQLAKNKQL